MTSKLSSKGKPVSLPSVTITEDAALRSAYEHIASVLSGTAHWVRAEDLAAACGALAAIAAAEMSERARAAGLDRQAVIAAVGALLADAAPARSEDGVRPLRLDAGVRKASN